MEKRWFIGFIAIVALFIAFFACKISCIALEITMPLVLCAVFTVLFVVSGLILAYIAFASLMGVLREVPDWVTANRIETLLMAFSMFILAGFVWR